MLRVLLTAGSEEQRDVALSVLRWLAARAHDAHMEYFEYEQALSELRLQPVARSHPPKKKGDHEV